MTWTVMQSVNIECGVRNDSRCNKHVYKPTDIGENNAASTLFEGRITIWSYPNTNIETRYHYLFITLYDKEFQFYM